MEGRGGEGRGGEGRGGEGRGGEAVTQTVTHSTVFEVCLAHCYSDTELNSVHIQQVKYK